MGKKKVTREGAIAVPTAESQLRKRIGAIVERRPLALALGFIAIGMLRIVATYPETGLTYDEPAHLACGMQYLAEHVYRYESQHPPLARLMTAIGPFLGGARLITCPI